MLGLLSPGNVVFRLILQVVGKQGLLVVRFLLFLRIGLARQRDLSVFAFLRPKKTVFRKLLTSHILWRLLTEPSSLDKL
jgi:hypothetical protein